MFEDARTVTCPIVVAFVTMGPASHGTLRHRRLRVTGGSTSQEVSPPSHGIHELRATTAGPAPRHTSSHNVTRNFCPRHRTPMPRYKGPRITPQGGPAHVTRSRYPRSTKYRITSGCPTNGTEGLYLKKHGPIMTLSG